MSCRMRLQNAASVWHTSPRVRGETKHMLAECLIDGLLAFFCCAPYVVVKFGASWRGHTVVKSWWWQQRWRRHVCMRHAHFWSSSLHSRWCCRLVQRTCILWGSPPSSIPLSSIRKAPSLVGEGGFGWRCLGMILTIVRIENADGGGDKKKFMILVWLLIWVRNIKCLGIMYEVKYVFSFQPIEIVKIVLDHQYQYIYSLYWKKPYFGVFFNKRPRKDFNSWWVCLLQPDSYIVGKLRHSIVFMYCSACNVGVQGTL